MGDKLDALLCAIQAAWTYSQCDKGDGYAIMAEYDRDEGWIADLAIVSHS